VNGQPLNTSTGGGGEKVSANLARPGGEHRACREMGGTGQRISDEKAVKRVERHERRPKIFESVFDRALRELGEGGIVLGSPKVNSTTQTNGSAEKQFPTGKGSKGVSRAGLGEGGSESK